MSIWKSTKTSATSHLLSRISQESKYPDDVWNVSEDPSSLCYVLCVSRKKDNGQPVSLYQKISREEFETKPDIVCCIARNMINRLTQDCRRANEQDRHMPLQQRPITEDYSYVDGKRPFKFFRCNKEVSEQYAHEFPEPLDKLRVEVALWLRTTQESRLN